MKSNEIWVSPGDPQCGWAPACYNTATNNGGFGVPAGQVNNCSLMGYNAGVFTQQVPRIRYTANQLIMPRERRAAYTVHVISSTAVDDTSATDHVLRYTNPGRFNNGNNYVFADTSARFSEFYRTIDPRRFQWGKAGYSLGGMPVVDRATGQPVQYRTLECANLSANCNR